MTFRYSPWLLAGLMAVLWLFSSAQLHASGVSTLEGQTNHISRELEDASYLQVEYWRDPELTIDRTPSDLGKVLNQVIEGADWTPIASSDANFGYTPYQYWFRFSLHNPGTNWQRLMLVLPASHLDLVEMFELQGAHVVQRHLTGEFYPYSQRPVDHPAYLLEVEMSPYSNHQYLFRIASEGAVSFPIEIWEADRFWAESETHRLSHGIYYGFLLFTILLNLFLFLTLRDQLYGYYALMVFGIALAQAAVSGVAFQYLWPQLPQLQNVSIQFILPFIAYCLNQFSRLFLDLRVNSPKADLYIRLLRDLGIVAFLGAIFLPGYLSKQGSAILLLLSVFSITILSYMMWFRGVRLARLFSCAWTFLAAGIVITLLYNLGSLPASPLTEHAIIIGSALEAALISLAIVERMYLERSTRIEVQQAILKEQEAHASLERQHLYEATHSNTTELPNQAFLQAHLNKRLKDHPEAGFYCCLIKLNRYQEVERTLGQVNASQMLYQIAQQLNEFLQEIPGVMQLEMDNGRPILLASVDNSHLVLLLEIRREEEDDERFERILKNLSQRIEFGYLLLDLNPKMGVSCYPRDGNKLDNLLRTAQIALEAPSGNNTSVAHYSPDFDPYNERRLTLMAELEQAIESDALTLHYQPIICLKSDRIENFEGLARWHHPQYGDIRPDEFILLAEQSGTVTRLTLWVIKQALQRLETLADAGYPDIGISVNISAVDLGLHDFSEQVANLLVDYNVDPRRLTLELTETALMENPTLALETLNNLVGFGLRIALDDFGTGYSSLAHINKLPLHKIKIDRALVKDVSLSDEPRIIASTAVEMCHGLGYEVVAEGVEDENTAEVLRKMGCEHIQGYWLARPMIWEFALEWLKAQNKVSSPPVQQHLGFYEI